MDWVVPFIFFIAGLFIIGMSIKRFILKPSTPNNQLQQYWEREHAAAFSRKKALPEDLFIQVDFSAYPTTDNPSCQMLYNKIMSFHNRPLVNLKGISNIELKEQYGSMQLEQLSSYEYNFIEYMNTSCKYGKNLYENGYLLEAQSVLEYIITLGCDLSQCFLTLAALYVNTSNENKLIDLKIKVQQNMTDSPYLNKVLQGIDELNHLHESEML